MQPIASDNISPNMEGNEFPAAKYPWKYGLCQWVICGKEANACWKNIHGTSKSIPKFLFQWLKLVRL